MYLCVSELSLSVLVFLVMVQCNSCVFVYYASSVWSVFCCPTRVLSQI